MRILKIEPFSGISGDMFVAAAAELAGAKNEVSALPSLLGLEGVSVEFPELTRASVACTGFLVHEEHHHHDDDHHQHRTLPDILGLLRSSPLAPGICARAEAIFRVLAEAEGAVHGIGVDDIHFHEVGAVDSILDITAAALLLERLNFDRVVCGPIRVGKGFIEAAHGSLPIPAPATELLLRGMPTWPGEREGEFTTPTGAAILRHLDPDFSPETVRVEAAAWGGGSRECRHPNALRLSLGMTEASGDGEEMVLIQANLDDMPPEFLGADLLGEFLGRGAADAFILPALMKKGRPGHLLQVLVHPRDVDELTAAVLELTLTLGVRFIPVRRRILDRRCCEASTPWGPVRAVAAVTPSGKVRIVPEYEDCRRVAAAAGVEPYRVYRSARERNEE